MEAKSQDMPPRGGYQKIEFKRIPARTYFSGYQMIIGYIGITVGATYLYFLNAKQVERENIEMRSSRFALYPLLFAERDREYLKQTRRNRDEEANLMKNVPGWVVGTWYGEPIFKTLPKEKLLDPTWVDFCAHASYKTLVNRAHFHLWN